MYSNQGYGLGPEPGPSDQSFMSGNQEGTNKLNTQNVYYDPTSSHNPNASPIPPPYQGLQDPTLQHSMQNPQNAIPNHGFYPNDVNNQYPYFGNYMYGPNAMQSYPWGLLQMQQLYLTYQSYLQQQQQQQQFQEAEGLDKQINQLSINPQPQDIQPPYGLTPITTPSEQVRVESEKKEKSTLKNKKSETSKPTSTESSKPLVSQPTIKETPKTSKKTESTSEKAKAKESTTSSKATQPEKPKQHGHANKNRRNGYRQNYNRRYYKSRTPNIRIDKEDYEFGEANIIDRDEIVLDKPVTVAYDKNNFFDNLNEDDDDENDKDEYKNLDRETFGTTRRPYNPRRGGNRGRRFNGPRQKYNRKPKQNNKTEKV